MEGTMKCGIYYGIENVGIEERPIPQIGPEDALIKVLRAGICGSDTGAFRHGGGQYGIFGGFEFGHEMVGKIVEKGSAVSDDLQVGDIVWVNPTTAKKAGKMVSDLCGAFSEYINVENAKADYNLYVLPKDVDLDAAALIEPVSVGTQGAVAMNPELTDHIAILGAGPIGLAAAAGLIARGHKDVVVIDRNDWKLEKAAEIGAKTINCKTENMGEKLLEIFGPVVEQPVDMSSVSPELIQAFMTYMAENNMSMGTPTANVQYFIDCAGSTELFTQAFNLSAPFTKYGIVAVYEGELPTNGGMFMLKQPMIYGSAGYNEATIREVIDHVIHMKTPLKAMITKKFPSEQFVEAMKAASYKENKNLKVIIEFED